MPFNPRTTSATSTPDRGADASADSVLQALQVREGRLDDLFPLMKLIAKELSLGRQHLAMATVGDAVKGSGVERIASLVAVRNEKIVAGALATRMADDAAQLIGFGCHDSVAPDQQIRINRALTERLHERLLASGITFAQASCDAADQTPLCATVGYQPIATLDYLLSDVATVSETLSPPRDPGGSSSWHAAGLECLPIDPTESPGAWRRMVELVQSTYEQTLDCPKLNAFRSAADVVGAYVTASSFQPEGWRVISDSGRDVACLVTVAHSAGKALELTYMGVSPSHRGRGIGRLLVSEAARIARKKAADRLVLAVDRINRPACDVYRQCGFEAVGSEAVWGRNLRTASSAGQRRPMPPTVRSGLRAAS